MMKLRAGAIFANGYEIVRPISAGGMGVVYEVIHVGTRRRRALKVMLPNLVSDPDMRDRFSQETIVTAEIESEHLTEVFDAGIDPETDCPYLAMELLRGEDLGARLKRGERFTAEETLTLLDQVARTLGKTHARGIIHRDLKPDNLFLTQRDDGSPRVKILDFGIAKVITAGVSGPNTTKTFGTPLFMAREQITGEGKLIGPGADIYALGQIVFALLTGEPYFQDEAVAHQGNVLALLLTVGKGPKESAVKRAARRGVLLPAAFDAWFSRATALVPAERFSSATDAMASLREVLREPVSVVAATLSSAVPGATPVEPADDATGAAARSQRVEPSLPPPASTMPMPAAPKPAPPAAHTAASETGSPQSLNVPRVAVARPWLALAVASALGLSAAAWGILRSPAGASSGQASEAPQAAPPPDGVASSASPDSAAASPGATLAVAPATSEPAVASGAASAPPVAVSAVASARASAAPKIRTGKAGAPPATGGAVWETR